MYFILLLNSKFWQSAAKRQTYVHLSHYINDIYDIYNRNINFNDVFIIIYLYQAIVCFIFIPRIK